MWYNYTINKVWFCHIFLWQKGENMCKKQENKRVETKRCDLTREDMHFLHFTELPFDVTYNICQMTFNIYDKRDDDKRNELPKVYCGKCIVDRAGKIYWDDDKLIIADVKIKQKLYHEIKATAKKYFELFDEGIMQCQPH